MPFPPHVTGLLAQGLRGALFLKIDATERKESFSQLVALIAASFVFKLAIDFAGIGPAGEFAFFGLPGALLEVPLLLAAAWSLAALGRQPESGLRLAVGFCAISLVITVFGEVLLGALGSRMIGDRLDAAGYFYPINTHILPTWLALAAAVAGIRLLELPSPRIGPAWAICALIIWFPLAQVGPYHTLWTYPYDEEVMGSEHEARDVLTGERAFYAQTALLDRALASLRPTQSDRTNLYFVGVAGDSSQDVFMKEVRYVGNFFKAHFGTSGRSINLINNTKSVEDTPAASVTSLRRSLNRIGEIMDPEKDILFLYLTSHGSREHRLTLDFGSIRFDELNPTVLRQLLDDSGIKHRVVIVSACYAGGFVKPLENADTLVITAAAPDKTSYGCSNEADFTYFGKAYFEDGLRNTDSFIKAFEIAAPLIAQREADAGYEAAQPMISIGQDIAPVLERYAAQERQAGQRITATRANHATAESDQSPQRCSTCP